MISPASRFLRQQLNVNSASAAKNSRLRPTSESWLDSRDKITAWIGRNSIKIIRALPIDHKLRMIQTMTSAELENDVLIALLRLLQSVHRFSDAEKIRSVIDLNVFMIGAQRRSIGLALAGLPK